MGEESQGPEAPETGRPEVYPTCIVLIWGRTRSQARREPFLDAAEVNNYTSVMADAATGLIIAEDYRSLPETGRRYQLIEGDLYMAPAPNRFHQDISFNIGFILAKYLEDRPIGKAYFAPFDVYLTEHDVFQPDLVFIARENFAILTDAGVEGAPDLVIEILSAKTAKLDRKLKIRVYARTGVKELWLVDPDMRVVEVFVLPKNSQQPAAIYRENDRFASSFFPGLAFEVAIFFKR
jgi:Uma2 family endonuclease